MSELPPQFIAKQKERLLKRRGELLEDLRTFAHKNPEIQGDWETNFPDIGDDEDENAQEIALYINELPVEYTLETELQKINSALKRIQNKTYGQCKNCSNPIAKERLGAYPEAQLCLNCAKDS